MKTFIILTIAILTVSCDSNLPEINQNDNNIPSTKSTNYNFSGIIENSQEEWYYSNSLQRNSIEIQDISNIDSIIFQAGLRTPYGNVSCYVDLYDLEDSTSIYGSELTNMVPYFVVVKNSLDLAYYFNEEKTYNLAVRIRSGKRNVGVQSGYNSYLTIYKKNL